MSLLFTAIAFIVALGTLIVFHELGHYWVARWCGVKVLRFSVGFGTPLRTWVRGPDRTEWVVAAFPLGGYVKMLDEREAPVSPSERYRAFNRQSVWKRIAIVSAGPIANFILAIVVYWGLYIHGVPGVRAVVAQPPANTPAAVAGFTRGETVVKVAGVPVQTFSDLRWQLLEHAVAHARVELETRNERSEINYRKLDLSSLTAEDLDGDFLAKVGLEGFQPLVPVVQSVLKGSAAEGAGVRALDRIVEVDGVHIDSGVAIMRIVAASAGKSLHFKMERAGQLVEMDITPRVVSDGGRQIGRIGVSFRVAEDQAQALKIEVKYGVVAAFVHAVERTWDSSLVTVRMMGKMVVGDVSLKNLSGPITIADYAGQSAKMGWLPYLTFIALISISLGVLNLLPVPLLDGGHLLYYFIEVIKRSPVSERTMEWGQRAGMLLLFLLMAFALYNDIYRLVGAS